MALTGVAKRKVKKVQGKLKKQVGLMLTNLKY